MSRMIRRCASGGNAHSFCAIYSLRMSAWTVPLNSFGFNPCLSATPTYIAVKPEAGALIVMLVLVVAVAWRVVSFDRNVGRVPELLLPLRAVLRPLFESLCLPFRFLALQLGEIFRVES